MQQEANSDLGYQEGAFQKSFPGTHRLCLRLMTTLRSFILILQLSYFIYHLNGIINKQNNRGVN